MLIDWFTVGAQLVNFLLLVWLLKRFLYKPVLAAIAAREKLIAGQLQDAAAKKLEAQRERDDFQHRNEEFERQRAGLLGKAIEEATTERQKLSDGARQDSEALRARLHESIINERENINREIVARTQREVFAIVRKMFADLSTTNLETSLGELFVRRLAAMDLQTKEKLAQTLRIAAQPALIRSAFDLPPDQRAAIQKALNELSQADIPVRFETATELICGLELVSNGKKIAWSVADYLTSLENSLDDVFDTKIEPTPVPLTAAI